MGYGHIRERRGEDWDGRVGNHGERGEMGGGGARFFRKKE
jgi:hypothetical protein